MWDYSIWSSSTDTVWCADTKTKINFTFNFPSDGGFALKKCMKPSISTTYYSSEQTTCRVTGDCLLKNCYTTENYRKIAANWGLLALLPFLLPSLFFLVWALHRILIEWTSLHKTTRNPSPRHGLSKILLLLSFVYSSSFCFSLTLTLNLDY